MRTAAICPTCATYTNAVCVIYDGPANLTNIPASPLQNMDQILVALNTTIGTINTTIANIDLQTVLDVGNSATNQPIILNGRTFYYGGTDLLLGTSVTSLTGSDNIHIGDTGTGNTGDDCIVIGTIAAENNIGDNIVAIGPAAGLNNQKNDLVAVGNNAGNNNDGVGSTDLGVGAGKTNSGDYLVAVGYNAGEANSGDYVVAIGNNPGNSNTFSNVNLIGKDALATGNNQTVLSGNTYQVLFNYNGISADRSYITPNASGTLVLSVNGVAPNSAGDVTLGYWSLTGNASTTPGTNFIGTTDNQDVVFKANNTEVARLVSLSGDVEAKNKIIAKGTTTNAITAVNSSTNAYASIGHNLADKGYLEISNGTNIGRVLANNLTSGWDYQLPNANGTFVLSVNGTAPNAAGNVTLTAPYKVWSAIVQYDGSNVLTVVQQLENTTGTTFTFAFSGFNTMTAASSVFTAKTVVVPAIYKGSGANMYNVLGFYSSGTVMNILSYDSNTVNTAWESNQPFFLEVRIYP